MKESYVEVAGLRLRVGRHGTGPPLLLITGIGANLEMWAPLEPLLPGHELIAFDAPGVGDSERPRLPRRMGGLADIALELMDALAIERADVLGYSFGGAVAQELARRAPDRVRRLVLCATAPGLGGIPPRPVAALMLATPVRYYHPRLLELTLPHVAGGRTKRDRTVPPEHAGARLSRPPHPFGYAYQLYAAAGWTSLPWLHRVETPTLIVAGDDDPAVPVRNARMLAKRLPNARLHIVRGGGHLFLLDDPGSAIGEIAAFLDL